MSAVGQRRLRLVVEPENLLRNSMGPACEEPALSRGCPPFHPKDTGRTHALLMEVLEKSVTSRIITNDCNRHHLCAKGSKIVRGVGPSSRNHLCLAMFQDQDRGFARHPGDVAVMKFVRNEITQENNRFPGEFFHPLGKVAKVHRCGCCLWGGRPLHFGCLKIQSTA